MRNENENILNVDHFKSSLAVKGRVRRGCSWRETESKEGYKRRDLRYDKLIGKS